MFACRGSCGLAWPLRLRPSHLNLCPNCLRAYKRSRAPSHQVRKWLLKSAYGTTPEWVEKQLAAQSNACAICTDQIALPRGAVPERGEAVVDHDHKHRFVRALLCGPCNRGLGSFKDDPALLRRAAAYIEKHAKTPADVDAHLSQFRGDPEPAKRRPHEQEEKHDPNESIESIVARMGREVSDVPVLLASLDEEEFIDATLADDDEDA